MICKEFLELEPIEQSTYLGKLIHAVQNDSEFFKLGKQLIELAEIKGLFDKVKFHHDINHQETTNNKLISDET